jgi:glutathione S-transferase
LQLTLADFLVEIHDTHHPVGSGLYYEDQKPEARLRAADFLKNRAPKYLSYFEQVLAKNARGGRYLVGAKLTYADLSMYQIIAGLSYAFPRAMAKAARTRAALRTACKSAGASEDCRIPCFAAAHSLQPRGIFRRYAELDVGKRG